MAFTFDDQAVRSMERQQKGISSHSKGVINEFLEVCYFRFLAPMVAACFTSSFSSILTLHGFRIASSSLVISHVTIFDLQGLTGLLQSPIKGAERHGLPGVLSGIKFIHAIFLVSIAAKLNLQGSEFCLLI